MPEAVTDAVAELAAASAVLGRTLHPRTAASLAALVRITNTYYSNLIEGHNTRPRDIERALAGQFDPDPVRRDLQIEAAAHIRVQADVDRLAQVGELPEPASVDFLLYLHRESIAARHPPCSTEAPRITGLPERTARRVFNDVLAAGLLASDTPKGPVSLRFPLDALDILFPRLFPET